MKQSHRAQRGRGWRRGGGASHWKSTESLILFDHIWVQTKLLSVLLTVKCIDKNYKQNYNGRSKKLHSRYSFVFFYSFNLGETARLPDAFSVLPYARVFCGFKRAWEKFTRHLDKHKHAVRSVCVSISVSKKLFVLQRKKGEGEKIVHSAETTSNRNLLHLLKRHVGSCFSQLQPPHGEA